MLTVYRASAGSGKTFTLAVEYIKLLVRNPMAYRQTLAVTFTNKATGEMKMRILSQLYGIWQGLDESADYAERVCLDLGVSREQAAERAGKALTLLLHDYSRFRVETIDAFFQTVLRNLARELELTANLRVGLNDVQVEEQAVDEMIDSLQRTDKMLAWVMNYIMDSIGEDRSWNVIGQIKQFGKTIFRDYYKQESHELNKVIGQEGFIDNYAKMLQSIRAKARERMKQLADAFFEAVAAEGLTVDDFANKSRGVCSIFLKMQRGEFDEGVITKTVADAVGNPSKWYAKTSPRAQLIHALADGPLGAMLRQAVAEQPRQWRLFKSADLTLRHISQLRLLNSIESRVRTMNEEANRFLLSDTQQLLSDVIEGSDSPFIYEKIGTQIEHIMIDEFQDTATVQWENFKVLLRDALSRRDGSALIVGDVKQSIYRWRSGDWRLLANIREHFAGSGETPDIRQLDTNWRSLPRIVRFNNAFFTEAARQEEVTAYDDVSQQWPQRKPMAGSVEVTLFPTEGYADATLSAVADRIQRLLDAGEKVDRIAVLVRNNAYIPLLANHLMESLPGVNVVSDEAFRLDASPAVQLLVSALRFIVHRDDVIARAFLAKAFSGRIDGQLPEAYAEHLDELARMPLYELAERLYAIFSTGMEGHSAYLCAFFDKVAEYVGENNLGIDNFLCQWEENICSTTIQSPELNGVRIISIHKSKGLEFPNVIIPFCDWRLEHSDILWCRPTEEPFSQLPLAPIDYSQKGMKGTIYEADYNEEHQQTLVDNLNLLYVAFTRASENLFVFGRRGSKASRSALIEQVLPQLSLEGAVIEGVDDPKGILRFTYGTLFSSLTSHPSPLTSHVTPPTPHLPPPASHPSPLTSHLPPPTSHPSPLTPHPSQNPFLQKSLPEEVCMAAYKPRVLVGQSNQSVRFSAVTGDEGAGDAYIQLGSVLHNVFSTIRTTADIDQALMQLEQEGIIYDHDITRQRLGQLIRKRLEDRRVADWFSSRWTVYNECDIILPSGETRRPDRVMTDGRETVVVDFKFGRERDEYHRQVREYMNLLMQMGLPEVSGYLWFVYSNKIVKVK